jgi:hypothetical protein
MDNTRSTDDLHNMFKDVVTKSSIKHVFFIFIFYIIITSNHFECNCLHINKEYQNNNQTCHLLKKGLFFIIVYICIDLLIQLNIL